MSNETTFICFHGQGFLGLSSAILVQVYDTFCKGKPSTFLLMLALLPTSVSILFMPLVRIYEANRADIDKKYLNAFSVFALLIRDEVFLYAKNAIPIS